MIIATFRQDGSVTERIASSIREVFMDAPNGKLAGREQPPMPSLSKPN
jgi:hypothetical protein